MPAASRRKSGFLKFRIHSTAVLFPRTSPPVLQRLVRALTTGLLHQPAVNEFGRRFRRRYRHRLEHFIDDLTRVGHPARSSHQGVIFLRRSGQDQPMTLASRFVTRQTLRTSLIPCSLRRSFWRWSRSVIWAV